MTGLSPPERPLSATETRRFEYLVACFHHHGRDRAEVVSPEVVRQAGRAAPRAGRDSELRWSQVVCVMAVVLVFAAATAALPEPFNLWVPALTMLVVVPAGCLVWGWYRGEL